jgi:hypothetical protein
MRFNQLRDFADRMKLNKEYNTFKKNEVKVNNIV